MRNGWTWPGSFFETGRRNGTGIVRGRRHGENANGQSQRVHPGVDIFRRRLSCWVKNEKESYFASKSA